MRRVGSCAGRALAAVGVLGGVAWSAAGQGVAEAYTLVELPPLVPTLKTQVFGINDLNVSAGESVVPGTTSGSAQLWDGSGSPNFIGTPPGFDANFSTALDIANDGTVLIELRGGTEDVVVSLADGTALALPGPGGGVALTFGTRLGEAGTVGATSEEFGSSAIIYFWERESTGMELRDISLPTSSISGGAMTPDGAFVASGNAPFGGGSAKRFDPRGPEAVIDVGPSGDATVVADASSSGYVVGTSDFQGEAGSFGLNLKAFVRTPTGENIVLDGFGCADAGFDPAFCSLIAGDSYGAHGVNEFGTVVGDTYRVVEIGTELEVSDSSVAFVWSEATGIVELSTLIFDGSADGWELDEATDINNAGWIVGNGLDPMGRERGFLLRPTLPCAADVNRDRVVNSSDFFAWVTAFTGSGCD